MTKTQTLSQRSNLSEDMLSFSLLLFMHRINYYLQGKINILETPNGNVLITPSKTILITLWLTDSKIN